MTLAEALESMGPEWKSSPPVNDEILQAFLADLGGSLPDEYLAFLRYSNGGTGSLGIWPGWFILWAAETVIEGNRDYQVNEWLPDWLGIGSSGGGEMLTFKMKEASPWSLYAVPFIWMDEEEAIKVADDFASFVKAIGHETDWNEEVNE